MKLSTFVTAALGLSLVGCTVGDDAEDLDPAGTLGDEEFHEEAGPVPEEEPSDGPVVIAAGTPNFQLPFHCRQVWAGQTRTNHSPRLAVDFNRANDFSDAVVAAAGGTVSRVANEGNTSYGRWIEINHGGGHRTRYAHLSAQIVRVGQSVRKGQKIGDVGNSGGSFGAHLHYEQRLNGTPVRPKFNGSTAYFYGTRNYTSRNCQ